MSAESDSSPMSTSMQTSSANGANTQEQHLREQLELLKSHDTTSSSTPASHNTRDSKNPPLQPAQPALPVPARQTYGGGRLSGVELSERAFSIAKPEAEAHIHPDLRARIAQAQSRLQPQPPANVQPHTHAPTATMMPIAPPSGHSPGHSAGSSAAPLAPAPSAQGSALNDPMNDGRKAAKRELSQSKRAAQNRAAQRAFRQRKEGYIKKLEQQVREFMDVEQSFKTLQSENYALRDYVIHLQSRLLDAGGEFPQPPPNVNLSQPAQSTPGPATSAPEPAPNNDSVGQPMEIVSQPLEAVAQAVAGLAAQEQMQERQHFPSPPPHFKPDASNEERSTGEEYDRQPAHESEQPPAQSPVV